MWVYSGGECVEFVGEDEEMMKILNEEKIEECRIQLCEHTMELTLNIGRGNTDGLERSRFSTLKSGRHAIAASVEVANCWISFGIYNEIHLAHHSKIPFYSFAAKF
jgi:hypothetical protein